MKFLIAGAGAIGGYMGALMARTGRFLDRLARCRAPRAHRVTGARRLDFRVHVGPQLLQADACVPLRGEPDLRPWLGRLVERGVACAMPVVVVKGAPLQFRSWSPGCRMEKGFWDIPVPADGAVVVPDILLAPVISEKSYGLLDENKYTFIVAPDANKTQIKIAVEQV